MIIIIIIGNSPMASILRDSILITNKNDRPRIIGLTASFVNGSLNQIIEKRKTLEMLMQANIISPFIPEEIITQKNYNNIFYKKQDFNMYYNEINNTVNNLLSSLSSSIFDSYEIQKWQSRSIYVFDNLGLLGINFFLEVSIIIITNIIIIIIIKITINIIIIITCC